MQNFSQIRVLQISGNIIMIQLLFIMAGRIYPKVVPLRFLSFGYLIKY